MKKLYMAFVVMCIAAISAVTLMGCTPGDVPDGDGDFGSKVPVGIQVNNSISANMSAFEMYNAGLANYYDQNYVAISQSGIVKSLEAPSIAKSELYLTSNKIKSGTTNFFEIHTASIKCLVNIGLMEEMVVENGAYRRRAAMSAKKNDDYSLTANNWKDAENFNSVALAKRDGGYYNDPTKMNMLNISSDDVISSSVPEYDAKTGQYTFTMSFNCSTVAEDYIPVMEGNMKSQGVTPNDLKFTELSFEVVMWDNGLIRSISSSETYYMMAKLPVVGTKYMKMNNAFNNNYSYNPTEMDINSKIQF